jgi:hypothetical protein
VAEEFQFPAQGQPVRFITLAFGGFLHLQGLLQFIWFSGKCVP